MKFTQSTQGIDAVNGGIGSIFKALAQAPLVRQQAEDNSALLAAKTYANNMAGNKYGSEAAGNQFTLEQRQAIPAEMPAPGSPAQALAAWSFRNTGDTNMERFAKAASEFQTQGIRDKAVANVGDLDLMNRYNVLAKPGETYMPFDNAKEGGYSINKVTGAKIEANPIIAKIYNDVQTSAAAENAAQAANAYASAGQHKASTEKINTEIDRIKAGGPAKPLTAAQLRENAAIKEAREAIAGMPQAEVDAILKENPGFMTADQRVKFNIIQRAQKPMFGETDVPVVNPVPAPPPAAPEPGLVAKAWNWLTAPDERPAAKSPAAQSVAPKMDAAPSQQAAEAIRAAYKAGQITRDEAKRQLQSIGFD